MTNEEKIKKIQAVIDYPGREETYYGLLEDLVDLKGNYADYMTTEPINCNEELQRVKNADYEFVHYDTEERLKNDHEIGRRTRIYHFLQKYRRRYKINL